MKVNINWYSENIDLPELDYLRLQDWLIRVAESYGKVVRELSYIFCDDDKIIEINRQFLQHDYYTDIITFDYSHGKLISGDMFISLDTVRTNAEMLSQPYQRELLRVIVHGVLHLCGINDKAPGEREVMEVAEDTALAML